MGEPARVLTIYQRPRLVAPAAAAITEKMTFGEAAPLWLESRRAYISEITHADYRHYVSRLSDYFGGIVLEDIDGDHVREFQALRGRTCGASVINHECSVLQQVLKRIGRWPVPGGYQPLPLPKESSGRCIEGWEQERYLRMAASNPDWEVACCAARIMGKTGICPGELCKVRLKDIKRAQHAICILHGKNQHRERWLALTDEPWAAVEQLLQRAERLGSREPDHYLLPFRVKTGRYDPLRPMKGWRTADEEICAAAGVKFRRYDWRHTAATLLLENPNVSTETAVAILGHVSAKMIRRVYNHTRAERIREALASLDSDPKTKRPEKSTVGRKEPRS